MRRILHKPVPTGNLRLTERDQLWIRAVHRFRFITTDQAELLSGSTSWSKLNQRLAQLYAHGYLDRPDTQRATFGYAKKRHVVHALGQRGAMWLREHDGVVFPKGKSWRVANQLKSGEYLLHQIGVVDTVLRFEEAIAAREELALTHQDELIAPLDWPPALRPYRLPTQVQQQGQRIDRATDPDYTFVLSRTQGDTTQRSLCFLEYDNASEDFIKANRLASSIAQKHRCYADAYERQLHTGFYGFKRFRVLFVVAGGAARVRKMQRVCTEVVTSVPKSLFWYATREDLFEQGPLAPIWLTGDGERVGLVYRG